MFIGLNTIISPLINKKRKVKSPKKCKGIVKCLLYWMCIKFLRSLTIGQRIRCKSTSPCKLWKLQSESLDQHLRGMGNYIILQSGPAIGLGNHTFANSPSHLSAPLPLDVDLMAQIEVSIVCTERLVCTYVPL